MHFEVVTNVYNGEDTLERFLMSLARQTADDFKLIIVDDGSTDDTIDIVNRYMDKLNISLHSIPHSGQRAARREATKKSTAPILVFLDADLSLESDAIRELIRPFNDEDIGIVTGLLKGRGNTTVAKSYGALREIFYLLRGDKKDFDWAPGGFFAIRRNILEKVGGYFTKKKGSGDLDLSWKVKKEGYNICFNEKAIAYHRDPDTLTKVWRREKRIGHQEYKLTKQHPKEIVKIRRLLRFYPLLLPFIVLLALLSWPLVVILVAISYIATLVAVNGSLKVRSMAWLVFNVMNIAYCTGFLSSRLTQKE